MHIREMQGFVLFEIIANSILLLLFYIYLGRIGTNIQKPNNNFNRIVRLLCHLKR